MQSIDSPRNEVLGYQMAERCHLDSSILYLKYPRCNWEDAALEFVFASDLIHFVIGREDRSWGIPELLIHRSPLTPFNTTIQNAVESVLRDEATYLEQMFCQLAEENGELNYARFNLCAVFLKRHYFNDLYCFGKLLKYFAVLGHFCLWSLKRGIDLAPFFCIDIIIGYLKEFLVEHNFRNMDDFWYFFEHEADDATKLEYIGPLQDESLGFLRELRKIVERSTKEKAKSSEPLPKNAGTVETKRVVIAKMDSTDTTLDMEYSSEIAETEEASRESMIVKKTPSKGASSESTAVEKTMSYGLFSESIVAEKPEGPSSESIVAEKPEGPSSESIVAEEPEGPSSESIVAEEPEGPSSESIVIGEPEGPSSESIVIIETEGSSTESIVIDEPEGSSTESIVIEEPEGSSTESIVIEEPEGPSSESIFTEEPEGPSTESIVIEEPEGPSTESIVIEEPEGPSTESIVIEEPEGSSRESIVIEEPERSSAESVVIEEPERSSAESVVIEKSEGPLSESTAARKPEESSSESRSLG